MAQAQSKMEEELSKAVTKALRMLEDIVEEVFTKPVAGENVELEGKGMKVDLAYFHELKNTVFFYNAPSFLGLIFSTVGLNYKPVQDRKECRYSEKGNCYSYCTGHLSIGNKTFHVEVVRCKSSKEQKLHEELSINVIEVK